MQELTAEQVRFHAAGHLSAAACLIGKNKPEAAKDILEIVNEYVNHSKVVAPEMVKAKVLSAMNDPTNALNEVMLLESWFVHPMNTLIEKSGDRF